MADSHVNGFPFTEFEDDLAVEVWHSRPSRHKYMIFHAMIEYTANNSRVDPTFRFAGPQFGSRISTLKINLNFPTNGVNQKRFTAFAPDCR